MDFSNEQNNANTSVNEPPTTLMHSKKDFKAALKDAIPMMIQVSFSALSFGILASQAGLTWLESFLMSALVYAGSSQFTAVGMMSLGAIAYGPILLTTLLVNLRHILYGTSLSPYMKPLSLSRQAILAFGLSDVAYALSINQFMTKEKPSYSYQFGSTVAIYVAWIVATGIGAALGGLIKNPAVWGIDFIMPACFITLVIPMLKGWRELSVCLLAGVLSIIFMQILPDKWYIIVATLVATIIGGGIDFLCEAKSSS